MAENNNHKLLLEIRRDIEEAVGQRVRVKANKGRRRFVEREGVLEKTYPSLFVVKLGPDQHNRRISYTYTDVLTEVVELTIQHDSGDRVLAYSAS